MSIPAILQHAVNAGRIRPILPAAPPPGSWLSIDLSEGSRSFGPEVCRDPARFGAEIEGWLSAGGVPFAYGGYGELRGVYAFSRVFDGEAAAEPRRFHLGLDVWGPAGTAVHCPLPGRVHSQGFLPAPGDYGAVVIVRHEWEGSVFHSLYGHLSAADLCFREGQALEAGDRIGHFGRPAENGHWPPHLHLQVVVDMEGMRGDYPGVCRFSERHRFLANCPDPAPLLGLSSGAPPGP
jgi:murein DD-endopeptidase MepM/ murein hydrolase activator NlpD